MRKTLTAIVMTAALGLGALMSGCYKKIDEDLQAVKKEFVVKIPKHDGELVNAGWRQTRHYVLFKNADGSMTEYVEADDSGWNKWDYQK